MHFWMPVWTFTWFVGLAIFTGLSIVITIYGAFDIASLLRSLKRQHLEQEKEAPESSNSK